MADQKLKIAMLSVHSCPLGQLGGRDTGGMNVYIRELACAMGERGHSVDIYTRAHDPRDEQVYKVGRNVRLIHIKAGSLEDMDKLAQYRHLADFTVNLEDFRRRNHLRYDIIHSHYWLSGEVGRRLGKLWPAPNIIMFHTLGAVKNNLGIGEVETGLRLRIEGELARDCQRIISATEREKRELVSYYEAAAGNIRVISCGVNLDLFRVVGRRNARRRLGQGGGRVILFVGRIEPLKGIDKLFEAVARLRGLPGLRVPGLRVIVIGGDEYSRSELQKLERLSRRLGIEESVSFIGSVPQKELPFFYSAADACIVPSYYETFGLVALESLACGTPVVATDVGAAGSIIRPGETGYLVADNTPRRLAEKIALLFSRDRVLTRSGALIRNSVLGFSWAKVAKAVIKEYKTVISARIERGGQVNG